MSKQKKITDVNPYEVYKEEEWHIPGYNFNGKGTNMRDRFSLSYKGRMGTTSFHLPVNKIDYEAVRHDLMYMSSDEIVRYFADLMYITNVDKVRNDYNAPHAILSEMVIGSKAMGRFVWEALKLNKIVRHPLNKDRSLMTEITLMMREWKTSTDVLKYMATKLPSVFGRINTQQIHGGARTAHINRVWSELKSNLKYLVFASFIQGKRSLTSPFEMAYGAFYDDPEKYKQIKTMVDALMVKYDKYLADVGEFDDRGDFVIKANIDKEKAEKDYVDFFRDWHEYAIKVSSTYYPKLIKKKTYQKHQILKLNGKITN